MRTFYATTSLAVAVACATVLALASALGSIAWAQVGGAIEEYEGELQTVSLAGGGLLSYHGPGFETALTVTSRTTIPSVFDLPEEIWLVALVIRLDDRPEGIAVRWRQEGAGTWFSQWHLQLVAPKGMLPQDVVDGEEAALEYVSLEVPRFLPGGSYVTTLSYDPGSGGLSFALYDAATGEEICAAYLSLQPYAGWLYPATGWFDGEQISRGAGQDPTLQAMEVRQGYERTGLPLALQRGFAWHMVNLTTGSGVSREIYAGEEIAVHLDWPGGYAPGDIRVSLVAGEEQLVAWAGPHRPERVLLPPIQGLPAGNAALRLEYVEGDYEHVIAEQAVQLLTNKIHVDWQLYGRNAQREPGTEHLPLAAYPGITGRATIRGERALQGCELTVTARYIPTELQVTSRGTEAVRQYERAQEILVTTTTVSAAAATPVEIPFYFAIPPGDGVVEVEINAADPGAGLQFVAQSATTQVLRAPLVPAFPGAEGFGAYTPGGRGGRVFVVTTLADSGPGSLRQAIEAEGPRIVVFGVSGTIRLKSRLKISNPYITIAGQTAPGDGIAVADFATTVSTHDVVIRHMRFRLGDEAGQESDAFSIDGARNVIIDHVSASWSVDETLSVADSDNITVQWSLISESLNQSAHAKGAHGYGSLIRGSHGAKYSFHHNLWAHHRGRSPRPGNYTAFSADPVGLLADFRNNVVYNWGGSYAGYNADTDSVSRYNFVGNYYVMGPNSTRPVAFSEGCGYARAYFAGNYMNGREPEDPWELVTGVTGGAYRQAQAFSAALVETVPAPEAYERVLAGVGATPRDSVDARVIDSVRNRRGRIIDSQSEVKGWPQLNTDPALAVDSSGDGIPDWWQVRYGFAADEWLDPADDIDGDGYTNIEEYINGTDPTVSEAQDR